MHYGASLQLPQMDYHQSEGKHREMEWSGVVYVNNADNDNNALNIRHLTIADSLSSCYGSPLYDIILSFSLQNT